MQTKSNCVVFIGMSYPTGVIRHFALLGCELFKVCKTRFDFYYASIKKEADVGSWNIVKQVVPSESIICTDTFEELVSACVTLAERYEKVLVHTGGGWGQTKHFVKARRRLGKALAQRIMFVGTTHSYRHDSWMRIPMSAFQYFLYRFCYSMIIFQCQYAADKFCGGNHLIRIGKGSIVPLGCEPFPRVKSEVPDGIGGNHKLLEVLEDSSIFKFVYLAAFRPGKMHSWLVRSIAPILRSHPKVRLILCGGGNDMVRMNVIKLIKNENLTDRVIVPGMIARDEVPWLLMHCNCAVVPSRSETFGHNFLEPMFAELPVLGTAVGIGRDIIKDGETGYKFSLGKPQTFQFAAERLLSNWGDTRHMGAVAKTIVKNDFTHLAVAQQLFKIYERLICN